MILWLGKDNRVFVWTLVMILGTLKVTKRRSKAS